ncbi:MAG: hypothetical protein ACPGR8_10285 [Limisphaerales bacterium]
MANQLLPAQLGHGVEHRHLAPKYALRRTLGEGSYGTVFLATGPSGDVALKIFKGLGEFKHRRFARAVLTGVFDRPWCIRARARRVYCLLSQQITRIVLMPVVTPCIWGNIDINAARAALELPAKLFALDLVHNDISPSNMGKHNNQYVLLDPDSVRRSHDGEYYGTFVPWTTPPFDDGHPLLWPAELDQPRVQQALTAWAALATAIVFVTGAHHDSVHFTIWRRRNSLYKALHRALPGDQVIKAIALFESLWAKALPTLAGAQVTATTPTPDST